MSAVLSRWKGHQAIRAPGQTMFQLKEEVGGRGWWIFDEPQGQGNKSKGQNPLGANITVLGGNQNLSVRSHEHFFEWGTFPCVYLDKLAVKTLKTMKRVSGHLLGPRGSGWGGELRCHPSAS